MGRRIGPAKITKYSLEFKLKAVQLSSQPGVLIKDVAESLCIHPFMLSKWRKQVRDGELAGDPPAIEPQEAAELRRLRDAPASRLMSLMSNVRPHEIRCAPGF